MSSTELQPRALDLSTRRFAVAWRNRVENLIHHVAVLDADEDGFRFQYLPDALDLTGFRPFLGFRELRGAYTSSQLWPFFDLRIMDPKRPDYRQYARWLGLPKDADRLDILARSGGEQIGDTVLLAEEPAAASSFTEAIVLVRGVSHAVGNFGTANAASSLGPGDRLNVVDEPTNIVNPRALLLTGPDGSKIGWVPDLLIDYARQLRRNGGTVTVVQNNGSDAPWHMRLLVRFAGQVQPGWSAFHGESWPTPMRVRP